METGKAGESITQVHPGWHLPARAKASFCILSSALEPVIGQQGSKGGIGQIFKCPFLIGRFTGNVEKSTKRNQAQLLTSPQSKRHSNMTGVENWYVPWSTGKRCHGCFELRNTDPVHRKSSVHLWVKVQSLCVSLEACVSPALWFSGV